MWAKYTFVIVISEKNILHMNVQHIIKFSGQVDGLSRILTLESYQSSV